MRVLLTDTETTSKSYADGGRVIEVAAALYETKFASVIESFSCLIKHPSNEAVKYNGIEPGLISEHGLEPADVWDRFLRLAADAECYVAHNAMFDRGFVVGSIDGLRIHCVGGDVLPPTDLLERWDPNKPWVCTMDDIAWPGARESKSLVQLALSLGLGVSSAHRAMTDVDTMARVLTRAQEVMVSNWLGAEFAFGHGKVEPYKADFLEPLIRRGMRPKKLFVAMVPFDMKDLAKAAGFRWNELVKGAWAKWLPPEDAAALSFRVREVSP